MGFSSPSPTPPPPPPAPAPAPTVDTARQKVQNMDASAAAQGRAATVLTSPKGAMDPVKTSLKTLLGV
jgi:hypothetical protein